MNLCNQKLLHYVLDKRRLVLEPENSGQDLKQMMILKHRCIYVGQGSHRHLDAVQILLQRKRCYLCISKMNFYEVQKMFSSFEYHLLRNSLPNIALRYLSSSLSYFGDSIH